MSRMLAIGASLVWAALLEPAMAAGGSNTMTCGAVKEIYKAAECCKAPKREFEYLIVPNPKKRMMGTNICEGTNPNWQNWDCVKDGVVQALEQAGGNVTEGFVGGRDVGSRQPIMDPYHETKLCPVNVHWHLGAEHLSIGQYDEAGKSPELAGKPLTGGKFRYGFACHHYDPSKDMFKKEYGWKHCVDMHVGETYEVHWPHSALGACGTPNQYQTPFYDGVFCKFVSSGTDKVLATMNETDQLQAIAHSIGVQAQVFTIVNDEGYYYPNLIDGMLVDGAYGKDITYYTGSTTGTKRSNTKCSKYAPITWQVDRKCHLISASSFDKMCADMKQMRDDMSEDLHAHGAREVVAKNLSANNQDFR